MFNAGEGLGVTRGRHGQHSPTCGYLESDRVCDMVTMLPCQQLLPFGAHFKGMTVASLYRKYSHSAKEEHGIQRGTVTCPRLHSKSVVGLDVSQVPSSLI